MSSRRVALSWLLIFNLEKRRRSLIESLIVVLVEDKRYTFFDSISSFDKDLEP